MAKRFDLRFLSTHVGLAICLAASSACAGELSIAFNEKGAKEGMIHFAIYGAAANEKMVIRLN